RRDAHPTKTHPRSPARLARSPPPLGAEQVRSEAATADDATAEETDYAWGAPPRRGMSSLVAVEDSVPVRVGIEGIERPTRHLAAVVDAVPVGVEGGGGGAGADLGEDRETG